MIKIQREDVGIALVLESVKGPESGGVVTFIGTVRDNAKGRRVAKMDIEVYESMALKQLEIIADEAVEKFGVHKVSIVHRYGELLVEDNIVYIAVAAGHRKEAFKACQYVIDELKQRVPIWKMEMTPKGDFWVEGEKRE